MNSLVKAAALGVGVLVFASPAAAGGDVKKGRQIAVKQCSRCHVVPDYNPFGGIGITASFKTMARMTDYLERFQTFFSRPPHPVFVQVPGVRPPTNLPSPHQTFAITFGDVDDLVAYVETLRGK